jgi:hypothetical protein
MSNKCIIALLLFATIAVLFACSDNSSDDSIKSLRIDAENAFRRGDYKKAYEICSRIVDQDSSVSFGYHGMAKAGFGERGINIADILSYIETKENDEGETKYQFAFLDSSVKYQNNIFQATKKVSAALAPIDKRDSLTSHYEFHQRGLKGFDSLFTIKVKNADGTETSERVPLAERFRDFRNTFCNAAGDCSDTNIAKTPFPLVDREYKGDYFRPFLLISHMVKSLLDFYDSDHNGCIAKRGVKGIDYPGDAEWASWGCSTSNAFDPSVGLRIENGKLIIDMKNITEDDAEALNDKIDGFSGDINEVVDIMDALGMGSSNDLKGDVGNFKGYSSFYKIGTGVDEDGDGCIEEDILDGQDNDGDGIKNGNARIARGVINHSMYGSNPESLENINNPINDTMQLDAPVYISNRKGVTRQDCKDNFNLSSCTELWGDSVTQKVTVVRFTQEPGYWTSNNMAHKLAIAQDTACPPRYSLEQRVELIGGCWPNYNEDKFVKYWLKRGLARDKNRIHPTCKACEGTEGCLK